ncbi:hypothetical protein VPH35_116264 [Triticum aestivum]|uniref:Uncharacterized protein n=1 Tax=Aegilops tauschii subsp. strangulata TaxID=200361 RepID=A0A453NGQ1_AEGTS
MRDFCSEFFNFSKYVFRQWVHIHLGAIANFRLHYRFIGNNMVNTQFITSFMFVLYPDCSFSHRSRTALFLIKGHASIWCLFAMMFTIGGTFRLLTIFVLYSILLG